MNAKTKSRVRKVITEILRAELPILRDSIAIYLHKSGQVSSAPFAGASAPYAADGSDEVVAVLDRGDWDSVGGLPDDCYSVEDGIKTVNQDGIETLIEQYFEDHPEFE